MRKTIIGATTAGAILATFGLFTASTASALPQPAQIEREKMGTCSSGARWNLDLEKEYRVIDINFEIDAATPGERWTIVVERNGSRVLRVSQVADFEGEVDVDHLVRDRAGTDRISVSATSASGQTCRGSLSI